MKRILILVTTCIVFLFSACSQTSSPLSSDTDGESTVSISPIAGGISKQSSIDITSFLSLQSISLPIHCEYMYTPSIEKAEVLLDNKYIEGNMKDILYTDIQEKLKSQPDVNVKLVHKENFSPCILVSKTHSEKTVDYMFLRESMENWYFISNLNMTLQVTTDSLFSVLLPIHLASDSRLYSSSSVLYANAEYETQFSKNEFYQFYEESGWYSIRSQDQSVILEGYKIDPIITDSTDPNRTKELSLPFPIKIEFTEHSGQSFFKLIPNELVN